MEIFAIWQKLPKQKAEYWSDGPEERLLLGRKHVRALRVRICTFLVALCLQLWKLYNKQRRLFSLLNPGILATTAGNVENDTLLQWIPLQTTWSFAPSSGSTNTFPSTAWDQWKTLPATLLVLMYVLKWESMKYEQDLHRNSYQYRR